MPNLKIVKLENLDYLTTFPDVSGAPNIEKLLVCDCKNLVEFHKSLGSLKRIFELVVSGCERLKRLPSRFEMESLKFLTVDKCSSLERFPNVSPCMVNLTSIKLRDSCSNIEGLLSSLGYLSRLNILCLGRYESLRKNNTPMCKEYQEKHGYRENLVEDDTKALESLPKSIGLQTLPNFPYLRELLLTCRPMESEVFLKNLQSFSSLAVLNLSGNNNLIRLPTTISHLCKLRSLNLNECHRLQILQGLPSSIQDLEANNCYSLEKIDDLSEEEYDWSYISFVNCQKLLKDENIKRYFEKMLQQSFFKRIAVIGRGKSIMIPGNKIPSWFKEEQPGSAIRFMRPPKRNNQIKGIAICIVFPVEPQAAHYYPHIRFVVQKDGVCFPLKVIDCINASPAGEKDNTWISYDPISFLWGFPFDCTVDIEEVRAIGRPRVVRWAYSLIYKEDVKSSQQNKNCTSHMADQKG